MAVPLMKCCSHALRQRKRLCSGTCLQAILIVVLIVTVTFNVMFIIDNKNRLTTATSNDRSKQNEKFVDENSHVQLDFQDGDKLPQNGIFPNQNGEFMFNQNLYILKQLATQKFNMARQSKL